LPKLPDASAMVPADRGGTMFVDSRGGKILVVVNDERSVQCADPV
jgi:hypothetical protein